MDSLKNSAKTGNGEKTRPAIAFGLAFLATVLFAALLQAVFGIRFETNDDATLANIAAGAYGPQSQYLVYINILVGYLIKPLYLLVPGFNWLGGVFYVLGLACFALVGAQLLCRTGLYWGGGAYGLLLLLAGPKFFVYWHYNKYAALFITVGLLLLVLNLGRWNAASIGGLALAFLGSLVRFDQLFAIGALCAALLLHRFLALDKKEKLQAAVMVAVLLAACFGARAADTLIYNADEGWATFRQYNAVRTEISDFRMQFADTGALLEAGFSENDIAMLDQWLFYDSEVFPLQRLETARDAMPATAPLGSAAVGTIKSFFWMFFGGNVSFALSGVLLAFWLLGKKRGALLPLAGTLGALLALCFYLQLRGRYLPRVEYSLVLAAAIFLAAAFRWKKRPDKSWAALAAGMVLVASVPFYNQLYYEMNHYRQDSLPWAEEITPILQDKENLYLVDVGLFSSANGFDVWRPREAGSFSNVVFVESWTMYTPFQEEALRRYGVENPYRDAVDAEGVYLVSHEHIEVRQLFLQQHYDVGIQLQPVEMPYSYPVWRYVTQPAD